MSPSNNTPYTPSSNSASYQSSSADNRRNIHDFIRNHKTLTIILSFAGIFLLAAIIILLITSNQPVEKIPEIAPIPYYEHRYLLDYNINRSLADDLLLDISNDILSSEEIASAPQENPTNNVYTISIDESSFSSLNNEPKYTYRADLSLSDGRAYTLYIRIDQDYGQKYMVGILNRTDISSTPDHIYIYLNPDLSEKEKETLTTTLTNWAKTLAPNNPTITNLDLTVQSK